MENFKKLLAKIGNAFKTAWTKVVAFVKAIDWNKRIGKSDKGTSDYLHPGVAYGVSGGALALAFIIALIAILPIA